MSENTQGLRKKNNSFVIQTRNRFVQGLLLVVPLGAIVFLIAWIFNLFSDFLRPVVERFIEWLGTLDWFVEIFDWNWSSGLDSGITSIIIRVVSLVLLLVLVYLIGWLSSNYLGRKLVGYFENIVRRVPIVKQIYGGAQQIINSFTGKGNFNKSAFREVVIVEFPRKGMRTLGFITNEIMTENGQKLYNIYIPSTPFMTGGYFEILSEDELTRTKLSVDEALQMVLSGGIISPEIISIEDDREWRKKLTAYKE